jgi:hypothetical protein
MFVKWLGITKHTTTTRTNTLVYEGSAVYAVEQASPSATVKSVPPGNISDQLLYREQELLRDGWPFLAFWF